jgi:hypothetical protein
LPLTRIGSPQKSQYHRTYWEAGIRLPGCPYLGVSSLIRSATWVLELTVREDIPPLPTSGMAEVSGCLGKAPASLVCHREPGIMESVFRGTMLLNRHIRSETAL